MITIILLQTFNSPSDESINGASITSSSFCMITFSSIVIFPSSISGNFSNSCVEPMSNNNGKILVASSSLDDIVCDCWDTIGPASILVTVNKTLTPTGFSPVASERWTGLAPRYFGNKLGYILTVPNLGIRKKRFGRYCP